MRHSGTYRRWAISIWLIGAVFSVAVVAPCSFGTAAETRQAFLSNSVVRHNTEPAQLPPIAISGIRFGNHAGLVRLVMELTGQGFDTEAIARNLKFVATAMTARDFLLTVWQAQWQMGQAPMKVDTGQGKLTLQVVHPGGLGGAARFRISSHRPAYVRRIFLLPPPRQAGSDPGTVPTTAHGWRLVLDLGMINGAVRNHITEGPTLTLPVMHGVLPATAPAPTMPDPVERDPHPIVISADTARWPQPPAPARHVGRATIESWAQASQLLQELQAHAAPNTRGPIKPQLILPEKYRQTQIPLR